MAESLIPRDPMKNFRKRAENIHTPEQALAFLSTYEIDHPLFFNDTETYGEYTAALRQARTMLYDNSELLREYTEALDDAKSEGRILNYYQEDPPHLVQNTKWHDAQRPVIIMDEFLLRALSRDQAPMDLANNLNLLEKYCNTAPRRMATRFMPFCESLFELADKAKTDPECAHALKHFYAKSSLVRYSFMNATYGEEYWTNHIRPEYEVLKKKRDDIRATQNEFGETFRAELKEAKTPEEKVDFLLKWEENPRIRQAFPYQLGAVRGILMRKHEEHYRDYMEAVTANIPTTLEVEGRSIDLRDRQRYLRLGGDSRIAFDQAFIAWVGEHGYFPALRTILRSVHPDPSFGKRGLGEGGHSSHDIFRGMSTDGGRRVGPLPDLSMGSLDSEGAISEMQARGYAEHMGNPTRPRYPIEALRDEKGRPLDANIVRVNPHAIELHAVDTLIQASEEPDRVTYRSREGVSAGHLGASPGLLPIDQHNDLRLGRDAVQRITADELVRRLTYPRDVTEHRDGMRYVSKETLQILEARDIISVKDATMLLATEGIHVVKRLAAPRRTKEEALYDESSKDAQSLTDYVQKLAEAWGASLIAPASHVLTPAHATESHAKPPHTSSARSREVMAAWKDHRAASRIMREEAIHEGKIADNKGQSFPDF